jgi:hypothetical protein
MSGSPWTLSAPRSVLSTARRAVLPTPPPGAAAPQDGVPVPAAGEQLGFRSTSSSPALWWVGVHGGAGESTLSHAFIGSEAAEHRWPAPTAPAVTPAAVVLVARSNSHGLRRAQAAAAEWASGSVPDVELLGLAVVADAPGRLPRPLRELVHLTAGGVPRTWYVPWVEAWRLGRAPSLETGPRPVGRMVRELESLTVISTAAEASV